ncbi:MAG: hypothetical protein HPY79_01815 [Bacteroidales bacterium]|nr:hypothetical protein [Bacteroidales bacterium]
MRKLLKYKALLLLMFISFIACKKVIIEFPKCKETIAGLFPKSSILTNNEIIFKNDISIASDTFILLLYPKVKLYYEHPCDSFIVDNYIQDFSIYTVSSSDTIKLDDTYFNYLLKDTFTDIKFSDFINTKQEILDKKPQTKILCLLKNNTYVPNNNYFRFMIISKLYQNTIDTIFTDEIIFTGVK